MVTALYLAHLNPVTNAHVEIIRDLAERADRIKVMPVVFRDGRTELNSRSFPFSFEARSRMLRAALGELVEITDDYLFVSPFKRYMPPLLSRKSWSLRKGILSGVGDDYFAYTGDRAEGIMLRLYRLRPMVGRRRTLSATSVKSRLYDAAKGGPDSWEEDVPPGVAKIIREEWGTVQRFADAPDNTMRVAGMKFPREGW